MNQNGGLNSRIVFFLGAGASRGEGYPLMSTFLDEMKQSFSPRNDEFATRRNKAFKTLLAFRSLLSAARNYVNTDFDNIESLYSAAEMYSLCFPDETLTVDGETLTPAQMTEQIAIAIWEMCRWRPFEGHMYRPPESHSYLWERILPNEKAYESNEVAFVTTNYDISLETAAWHRDMPACYGKDIPFGQSPSSPKAYTTDNRGPAILKLHGSVNWFSHKGEVVVDSSLGRYSALDDDGVWLRQQPWPAVQTAGYQIPAGSVPFIVPPTFSKTTDSPVLKAVWRHAVEYLSTAKLIVFIGYSFPATDTFVTHMLNVSLLNNHDLRKVVVIDPEPSVERIVRDTLFNSTFSAAKRLDVWTEEYSNHTVAKLAGLIADMNKRATV